MWCLASVFGGKSQVSSGIGRSGPHHLVPPRQDRGGDYAASSETGVTLVVDDNADLREGMREILEPLGLEVVEAANGQEAFNFLVFNPTVPVSLIILDLMMPVMDGWQFLTLLKSYIRLSKIPVVVASSVAGTMQACDKEGLAACLQTPSDLPRLAAVVQQLVHA
jgi:CheY-like chemotaxis protein